MEAQLLQGLSPTDFCSSLDYLSRFCTALPLPDVTVSIALELLVISTREYELLQLHPCLLAACCLYVAVRNSPSGQGQGCCCWNDAMSACCGYTEQVSKGHNPAAGSAPIPLPHAE